MRCVSFSVSGFAGYDILPEIAVVDSFAPAVCRYDEGFVVFAAVINIIIFFTVYVFNPSDT